MTTTTKRNNLVLKSAASSKILSKKNTLTENDVTDEALFKNRRKIIASASIGAGLGLSGLGISKSSLGQTDDETAANDLQALNFTKNAQFHVDEPLNSFRDISSYNNFYEFSLDKRDPAILAQNLKTSPWTVTIDGECDNPMTIDVDDIINKYPLEERIYRFRCVEAWSMVIPWVGFPLKALIDSVKPNSKAKYIAFETLYDPNQMPEQRPSLFGSSIDWPYREGLRIDEAVHPLTLMTVGLYGKRLPNQNGAPLRLVVPWKYGFKSIKSIVRITLTEEQPATSWNLLGPQEYGFYANVNPNVDHPRWSQAKERRIGEILKRKTLMFNGYEDEVASLYDGMDLTVNY